MAKGSFKGLYTFDEIATIYKMDSSNLRKMVQFGKFIEEKEIKKFGKTWLITEDAVRKHFGNNIDIYIKNEKLQKKLEKQTSKTSRKSKYNNDLSFDKEDDRGELTYIEVDPASVINSFNFSK